MNLVEFLQDLSQKGVRLWSEGGKLRSGGSQEVLTPEVIALLKEHKTEILHLLSKLPDISQIYPLSYGQKGLWFLWKLSPDNHNYNVSTAMRMYCQVDIIAWQQTFQALKKRHPLLRTTFPEWGDQPVQQVHENQELDFLQIDASTWSEEELHKKVVEAHRYPFDLETDSVIRVRWFTVSNQNHVMLLTFHHIVFDGWSGNLIAKEIPQLYQAICKGEEYCLSPLNYSYQDYVRWQKELVEGEKGEKLWEYWQQKLAGDLPVLNLPTDRPRPPIQTDNGAAYPFKLSEKLTQQLKELAKQEGVTPNMALLAAFQILLYRYTGQEDILVGSPTAGRTRPEFASIVGHFVDSVVMRADLSGNPCFRDFLSQVRQTVLGSLAHQDYPFALIVERLQQERDPSRSPLFQASFVLQKLLAESQDTQKLAYSGTKAKALINLGGLEVETFVFDQFESQFDVFMQMLEENSYLFGSLKYNTDLFDEQTIAGMVAHFQTLLEGIVSNPEQRVGELPIFSETEKQQLLVTWNDTKTDYPTDKCIYQLFEEQVEKTPNAVAVVFEQQSLTYSQLNRKANQLAHYLQKLGVVPETLVGICIERSIEMVVGLLAILKAGGAYVPLDPSYPSERLAYMVSDAQVSLLLTQESLVTLLPEHQGQIVCLDSNENLWSDYSQDNLSSEVIPSNLGYVIYTSGSTGKPKGVAMSQGSLVNLLQWQQQETIVGQGAKTLQFAPISFDVSFQEIFSTWCSGGTLVLVSSELRLDPLALMEFLTHNQVERLFLPFVALQQLASVAYQCQNLPPLREIVTAGEQLQVTLDLVEMMKRLPQCRLQNQYGPSESHVVSAYTLEGDAEKWPKLPPIGRPIANAQLYVLSREQQPVPVGVPGELYIGGAGLANGYLNRLELTSKKFISNPFENSKASKLYKTGDLARYLADGNIEFLGRIDHQVKIRGYRIETGEIEATITQYAIVKETVVLATENNQGNKHLVAYLVLETETPASSNSEVSETEQIRKLKQYLKERLPEYMIPSGFVVLSQLPLTPSGKVNRKALPVPDNLSSVSTEFVAPETETEKVLAEIWAEVLGIEKVGIHDNFFDLGGHSLIATQVVSRVRKAFAMEISVSTLFENSTIAKLAENLVEQQLEQVDSNILEQILAEVDG
ncbi:amino acid adenylation domain-containing protein [Okeania sp. SIO2B3]|uniref:non-ribosomal peptide synthetase n=1 Tax=Okeania sp. SIO2B3 TaxID=2607784 RepID=UPI0013C06326|nr:amino acid adenylation domain-containing protein [Okeania sp. SIO2B3]NET45429.1 amino acid adenylation domain-containing protein [Okeania sp. SIO2B3]